MAREWQAVTGNYVALADLGTGLRCERSTVFTTIAFIAARPGNDERAFWSKDDRQWYMRIAKSTPNGNFQVVTGGNNTPVFESSLNPVVTNRWYVAAATCDGTEAAGDGHAFLIDTTDGTVHDDTDFNVNVDSGTLTGNINCGSLRSDTNDEYDGRIFCASYFTRQFTLQDVKNYLKNPFRVMQQYLSDSVFFWALLRNDSPEPDWSGNQRNGTVTGTNFGILGNPPVAPFMGFDLGWQGILAGAAPPAGIEILRRRIEVHA